MLGPWQARHALSARQRLRSYLLAHPGSLQPGVLTFGQLQKLPANPAALTAKIVAIDSAAEHWSGSWAGTGPWRAGLTGWRHDQPARGAAGHRFRSR
jgi:hypothetical protein